MKCHETCNDLLVVYMFGSGQEFEPSLALNNYFYALLIFLHWWKA